jgi:hypothetical protein
MGEFTFIKESSIKYSKEEVLKQLKGLRPLKYNKFRWWRLYSDDVEITNSKTPLEERILNGEFNPSTYKWQAQLTLHNAKEKVNLKTDDHHKQLEMLQMDLNRYKRLMEDYEKEEFNRLESLYAAFSKEFNLTKEEIESIFLNATGSILDCYKYLKNKL